MYMLLILCLGGEIKSSMLKQLAWACEKSKDRLWR